jgi:hypothetical protein
MNKNNYHGIILNISQRDKSIFKGLNIIGKKRILLGTIILYKVNVAAEDLELLIQKLQSNMSKHFLHLVHEFYCHFYQGNELIVVFRNNVFLATTDRSSWKDAIEYGKGLGIPMRQLDFIPYRVEDEIF